jgi:DNA-binding NtrC family response regulator
MKPTILIIEDDAGLCRVFSELLTNNGYEVICLFTFDQASAYIDVLLASSDGHGHIHAVLFDFILEGDNSEVNSSPLIRKMREAGFKGIMLANALNEAGMSKQMEAGCTHVREEGFEKEEGAGYLEMILRQARNN